MGMDMAPHVVKRSQSSWSLPSHWSPWRRSYGLGRNPDDYLYDLYAVCNHHGNMHGGHYTGNTNTCNYCVVCKNTENINENLIFSFIAYCKNSIDGQWYCFDDSEVSPIADDDVCQQTAYILFYQRRTAIPSWSANSSVAGQYLFFTMWTMTIKWLVYFCWYHCFSPQVLLVHPCVTTGSTDYQAAGLLAWLLEPHLDAPLWLHWLSQ